MEVEDSLSSVQQVLAISIETALVKERKVVWKSSNSVFILYKYLLFKLEALYI